MVQNHLSGLLAVLWFSEHVRGEGCFGVRVVRAPQSNAVALPGVRLPTRGGGTGEADPFTFTYYNKFKFASRGGPVPLWKCNSAQTEHRWQTIAAQFACRKFQS